MLTRLTLSLSMAGAFALGAALLFPSPVLSSNAPAIAPEGQGDVNELPPAKDLFKAMLEAMGGKDAFDKIKSTHVKSKVETQMGNVEMESRFMPPDRFLMEQSVPGMGRIRMGSDGEVGWMHNPMMGYDLIPKEQLEGMGRQANMHMMLLQMDDEYEKMETVGTADFQGNACYKVKLAAEENDGQQHVFINRETKLAEGMEIEQRQMGRAMTVRMIFDDWKDVGDVKLFHKLHIEQQGQRQTMEFTSIELNSVDEAVFELPEQVRELVRQNRAEDDDAEDDNDDTEE